MADEAPLTCASSAATTALYATVMRTVSPAATDAAKQLAGFKDSIYYLIKGTCMP